jgi:hypothetical protein
MMTDRSEALKAALIAFAKAVDKAICTELGSRPGNPLGERIASIEADIMDDAAAVRPIQRARDRLVELGVLEAVQ